MTTTTPDVDLSTSARFGVGPPFEVFAQLREHEPVKWNPTPDGGFWSLTRYEDIDSVMRDWKTFSPERAADSTAITNQLIDGVADRPAFDLITEIAGVPIKADEPVVAWHVSAHRDPAANPDPDRFDVTRTGIKHWLLGMPVSPR